MDGSCSLSHSAASAVRGEPTRGLWYSSLYVSRFGGVEGAEMGALGFEPKAFVASPVFGRLSFRCKACNIRQGELGS